MVSIRYFAPDPALSAHVSSYYWFESNDPQFRDLMRAELAQIRLITVGEATNHYAGGRVRQSLPMTLQGPTNGPVHFVADGPLHLFGIGLLPLGWAAMIGTDASVIADDAIDLATIAGASAALAYAAIAGAGSDAERVAAADALMLDLLNRGHAAPGWFTRLTDDWLTASDNPDVDALVAASGMSSRSVERLAKRIYGASPKLLARKYRALHAAVRIGNGEIRGFEDLPAGAFYDQAHFCREFKEFTGMSPSRFAVEAAPVSRITIARKQQLPDLPKLALYS